MITHFDNLDYFNKKRLLDNEVYGALKKLKDIKDSIPEASSGLDYYKMWLSIYNKNKNSITSKSNVESYFVFLCDKQKNFDRIVDFLEKEFEKIFNVNGWQILIPMLDFVFDRYNIKTIKKLYRISQKDILIGLKTVAELLTKYWS